MTKKKKKGFWMNVTEPDRTKTRKFVGPNSSEAKIGKWISDLIDKLLK